MGKTALTVNLAAAAARRGKDVVLVDLDLGASNVHTFLGIKSRNPGLGGYISKKIRDFTELPIPTIFPG